MLFSLWGALTLTRIYGIRIDGYKSGQSGVNCLVLICITPLLQFTARQKEGIWEKRTEESNIVRDTHGSASNEYSVVALSQLFKS